MIRSIYFYAASLITLVMIVISAGQLVDIALKSTFFPKADQRYGMTCDEKGDLVPKYDAPRPVMPEGTESGAQAEELTAEEKAVRKAECEQRLAEQKSAERQSDIVNSLSMLVVATPVFWFHFRVTQRERHEGSGEKTKGKKA